MEVRIQLMEAQEFREWADRAWVAAGALCRPIRPYEIGQLMGFAPILHPGDRTIRELQAGPGVGDL